MQVGVLTFTVIPFEQQLYLSTKHIDPKTWSNTYGLVGKQRPKRVSMLFTTCSIQVGGLILVPYEYANAWLILYLIIFLC